MKSRAQSAANKCFGGDYRRCRRQFLISCADAGATLRSYRHPLAGLDGDPLFTDVAVVGDPEALNVLFLVSGTHGVEGLCGSGIQTALLCTDALDKVLRAARLVLVHSLNPYGFSWLRRINEDGVDVNRNFIDFHRAPPRNEAFAELAELLVPPRWTAPDIEHADRRLVQVEALWGRRKARDIIARGQYTHPRSIHYGGRMPSWSNWVLRQIARDHCAGATQVVLLDIHSGLGPRGMGQMIVSHGEGSAGLSRARATWGSRVVAVNAEGGEYSATGSLLDAFEGDASDMRVTCAALEFGTEGFDTVWTAIRADQWLHSYGQPDTFRSGGEQAERIRAQVRDAFYLDTPAWRASVWEQSEDIISGTCEALVQ